MAKLDATSEMWVVRLANYNLKLHYKSGKLNVEVDVLSWIPWEQEETLHTLDAVLVKAIINRGCSGYCSIPKIPLHAVPVVVKSLWLMAPQRSPNKIGRKSTSWSKHKASDSPYQWKSASPVCGMGSGSFWDVDTAYIPKQSHDEGRAVV